ncbi:hypothetical protein [Hymenobacter sp. BT190]|uniref:hypothetical protein n=1 Tax=Hymenobacter sp. BT190 TaxID=2763505 RepID=UPI0016515961|nr:hypothetical protein [Hymenobacter sp. BT190]MBC6698095.1 hypothetical protein [Hymenobacter sp. BT190]
MAIKTNAPDTSLLNRYISEDAPESSKSHLAKQYFDQLFKGNVSHEAKALGADIYVKDRLVVELKNRQQDWLAGFYQALHYSKKGLTYGSVCVIAHRFIGLWRLDKIPSKALELARQAGPILAASEVGVYNAAKSSKDLKLAILEAASYRFDNLGDGGEDFAQGPTMAVYALTKHLRNLDTGRFQINPHNFISIIEEMKQYFERPIDAVHTFYDMVGFWDATSTVPEPKSSQPTRLNIIAENGGRQSEDFVVSQEHQKKFRAFVGQHYLFTNERSGLTADYYFSRFDEVMSKIDPEYTKQHGIFFTDNGLSKFALWFVRHYFDAKLSDNYVVFDAAAGSGNLVSSWRGHLKHKIISELQPDLLRIIDRRLSTDPLNAIEGFTIIPKVSEDRGLNFLSISAGEYYQVLKDHLSKEHVALDKPFAFLMNPPYKNTDENSNKRERTDSGYDIHPSILSLTGADAGKERYLAFLGQILRMAQVQVAEYPDFRPVMLIFTPTSWLIPRPTYAGFRKLFDEHFEYGDGFVVTSNAFFKLKGTWPLAFTVWTYRGEAVPGATNEIKLRDFTHLTKQNFDFNWEVAEDVAQHELEKTVNKAPIINLSAKRGDIRTLLPSLLDNKGKLVRQPRVNIYRPLRVSERGQTIVSGFPLTDTRHRTVATPYGFAEGKYIGFMDDLTPVRVNQDTCNRLSNKPDRVWFQLRPAFIDINLNKVHNGPPDKYGYCAYDLPSARATFAWFTLSKVLNAGYPVWANQYDLWAPNFSDEAQASRFYRLCYAYVLAENRCIVLTFEADNPVVGAPEIFLDNPLCPLNPESFWARTIAPEFFQQPADAATHLVEAVENLYRQWTVTHCKGHFKYYSGLQTETYFKHFTQPDYLTPRSGLLQIRRYAEQHAQPDLLALLQKISLHTKAVREELQQILKLTEYFA